MTSGAFKSERDVFAIARDRLDAIETIADERTFGEQTSKRLPIDRGAPRADRLVAEKSMGEVGVGGETRPANILAQRFPPVRRGPVGIGCFAFLVGLLGHASYDICEPEYAASPNPRRPSPGTVSLADGDS